MTHGTLGDISESGARFEADDPPGKGATAVLKWGEHEAVCTIIWHEDGACGVWFKQKLSAELVEATAAMDRVVELPIASVGNITQGRRRSAGFLKRATIGEDDGPVSLATANPDTAPGLVPTLVPTSPPISAAPLADTNDDGAPPALARDETDDVSEDRTGFWTAFEDGEPVPAATEGAKIVDVIRGAFRFPRLGRKAIHGVDEASDWPDPDQPCEPLDAPVEQGDAQFAEIETNELPVAFVDERVAEISAPEEMAEYSEPPTVEPAHFVEEPLELEDPASNGEAAYGRAGGLAPPTIGHSPTLAEVLRRYRETGDWQR